MRQSDNQTHRNTVTKIHPATHCLATATDTFNTDIADNEKFTCKICSSGEPEDSNHLILHCNHPLLLQPCKILPKYIPKSAKLSPKNITLTILNYSFTNTNSESFQKYIKPSTLSTESTEPNIDMKYQPKMYKYMSNL